MTDDEWFENISSKIIQINIVNNCKNKLIFFFPDDVMMTMKLLYYDDGWS